MNDIYLQEFCRDEPGICDLSEPWSAAEYSYAASGYICIRIPRNNNIGEKTAKVPDVVALFREAPPQPERGVIIPKVEVNCIECEVCNGAGHWGGIDETFMLCCECEGEGKYPDIDGILIGGAYFWKALIAKLTLLPNCKIAPTGPDTAAWIKFDGGDGLVMPMCGVDK